jgi:hypothetical protein
MVLHHQYKELLNNATNLLIKSDDFKGIDVSREEVDSLPFNKNLGGFGV